MKKTKSTITCNNCKFFNEFCRHQSNTVIEINKKIEKLTYKDTKKKKEICENFENV